MSKTTIRSISIAATALCLTQAATVSAIAPPSREVHVNMERLAELPATDQVRVLEIKDRLDAIIATDHNTMTQAERKELRGEWRTLKQEMKDFNRSGTVIYISGVGLIIIIILLIILL